MQRRIPAVFMRGGTSKAVFFHDNHLPQDPEIRERVILAAYGSPDPNKRQIDGMGGAVSATSKVAIISPSKDPAYDVNYNFGQVCIDKPKIGYQGNCGNISSAVGPFAIDEGLVNAEEPITTVRIYQANTKKLIVAEVPVKNGLYNEEGDFAVDGVPGTGGKVTLHFFDPGGSVTGKLLPTNNVTDVVEVPGVGEVAVSIIDAANPVVFLRARDLGLTGTEIYEIEGYFYDNSHRAFFPFSGNSSFAIRKYMVGGLSPEYHYLPGSVLSFYHQNHVMGGCGGRVCWPGLYLPCLKTHGS